MQHDAMFWRKLSLIKQFLFLYDRIEGAYHRRMMLSSICHAALDSLYSVFMI